MRFAVCFLGSGLRAQNLGRFCEANLLCIKGPSCFLKFEIVRSSRFTLVQFIVFSSIFINFLDFSSNIVDNINGDFADAETDEREGIS